MNDAKAWLRQAEADFRKVLEFKNNLSKDMPVKKIILFGSRATGKTHEWSDFDLIIASDKFKKEKSFKRASVLYDYWDYNYPVDFLCYTVDEFNKLKKRITIVREAVKEGIEIK